MSELPLISIIIPVFNRADIFVRSLQTALAQDYQNTEIIVVDDGSEPMIVLPTEVGVNKIQLFRQPNQGAPAARNFGFSKSQGEYIIFWDADLIARPDFLTKLLRALRTDSKASYAYCNYHFGNKKMPAQPFNPEVLRKTNYITTSSLIRRNDFFGFDITLQKFQDWDLWLTLLEQNKTGMYVPEYLFEVEANGTMSAWLPRCAYRAPWKWLPGISARVKRYEQARAVIVQKHRLPQS